MQDNYRIQSQQAKAHFLQYDQQALIKKHHLQADDTYLYFTFLGAPYRICRKNGDLSFLQDLHWMDAESHGEIMTVLDLICDSREDRHLSGRLQNMQAFGHQFHQNLGENNPDALFIQSRFQTFRAACESMGGTPFPLGDLAYTFPVFEDLNVTLQFFMGDEEFKPRLLYLWDENALQYLKYETMYYAVDALMGKLKEKL